MQQKTSDFRKNFSEGLKYARLRRGLTQAQVAEYLGEGETTITNWETGTNGPHRSKLVKLGDYFGAEIDPFTGRWEAKRVAPGTPTAPDEGLGAGMPAGQMSEEDFRAALHRCSMEALRRNHLVAARVMMDLLIALGGPEGDGLELTPDDHRVADRMRAELKKTGA